MIAAATATAYELLHPDTETRVRHTCFACRKAKIKCDRGDPCSRCTKYGLDCIEQPRGQGRPAGYRVIKPQNDQNHSMQSSPSNVTSRGGAKTGGRLSYVTIQMASAIIVSHCANLFSQRRLQINKTRSIIRSWGLSWCRGGVDSSFGALSPLAMAVGADMDRLKLPSGNPCMNDEGSFMVGVVADGSQALYSTLKTLDDGMSPFMFFINKGTNCGVYCSDRFGELYLTSAEACDELHHHHKVLPDYLWASFIAPSCLQEFYQALANCQFGRAEDSTEFNLVTTVRERSGQEGPALVRVRHVVFPDGEYSSTMLSIIPFNGAIVGQGQESILHMPYATAKKDAYQPMPDAVLTNLFSHSCDSFWQSANPFSQAPVPPPPSQQQQQQQQQPQRPPLILPPTIDVDLPLDEAVVTVGTKRPRSRLSENTTSSTSSSRSAQEQEEGPAAPAAKLLRTESMDMVFSLLDDMEEGQDDDLLTSDAILYDE